MKWSQVANPIRLVSLAWIAVVGLGLAVGIQVLTSPWVYERVTHGGESAVAPGVWFVIDCLLVIWLHAPQLAFFVLALAAWATWRVVVPSLPSMRTDFLSRHIRSSPLRLLTERPASFHRHCL